jgi:hypothetical protein
MARTLKDRPATEFADAAKAVLEHHFDNHQYCGPWCRQQHETPAERQRIIKHYRSKEVDAELYNLLHSTIDRFVSVDKLLEMAHAWTPMSMSASTILSVLGSLQRTKCLLAPDRFKTESPLLSASAHSDTVTSFVDRTNF